MNNPVDTVTYSTYGVAAVGATVFDIDFWLLVIVGSCTVITMIINAWYRKRRDDREKKIHELLEKRYQQTNRQDYDL